MLGRPWQATVDDPRVGSVRLTGIFHPVLGARVVVVIVHGIGGSANSPYCLRTAATAHALGMSSLRLNQRGADRRGEDLYHAGLWTDLRAAIDTPEVARHDTIVVIGFSLGGHTVLRLAVEDPGRCGAVAAICAPLDLGTACRHIDAPGVGGFYRAHLLRALRDMYRAVAARRPMALSERDLRDLALIHHWDERVIAPRFGFDSVAQYHQGESVADRLTELKIPAFYLGADGDPMVSARSVRPVLEAAQRVKTRLAVRWLAQGGHVGFPLRHATERTVLDWLARNSQ